MSVEQSLVHVIDALKVVQDIKVSQAELLTEYCVANGMNDEILTKMVQSEIPVDLGRVSRALELPELMKDSLEGALEDLGDDLQPPPPDPGEGEEGEGAPDQTLPVPPDPGEGEPGTPGQLPVFPEDGEGEGDPPVTKPGSDRPVAGNELPETPTTKPGSDKPRPGQLPTKPEVNPQRDGDPVDDITWHELQERGSALGVYRAGMARKDLEKAIIRAEKKAKK